MEYLPKALEILKERDRRLCIIIDELPPKQYEIPEPLYIELISSIVSQQLSLKVAKVIWHRFLELFPDRMPTPERVINTEFDVLRSVGLSNAKAQYILNVSHFFQENNFVEEDWHSMDDTSLVKTLTSIKGVGIWTVQMLQIFSLYKTDIWPTGDLGIRQGFATLFGVDASDKQLVKYMNEKAEIFRPYRSALTLTIWHWKDQGYPQLDNISTIKI